MGGPLAKTVWIYIIDIKHNYYKHSPKQKYKSYKNTNNKDYVVLYVPCVYMFAIKYKFGKLKIQSFVLMKKRFKHLMVRIIMLDSLKTWKTYVPIPSHVKSKTRNKNQKNALTRQIFRLNQKDGAQTIVILDRTRHNLHST